MVWSLVVAVKGTAVEILHHLLLTKRRGKSPIRLWKVKLVALRSFDSVGASYFLFFFNVVWGTRRHPALLLSAAAATGLFFKRTAFSLLLGPSRLRSSDDCSFLPSLKHESRVHPSARSLFGCQITERGEREKSSTSDRAWVG